MRRICPLLACFALLPGGCTACIIGSGQDLWELPTREQVHREFGTPIASGTAEGQPYEEFQTRRKIAEPTRALLCSMSAFWSLGLTEITGLPSELYLLGNRTMSGQTLRFTYDLDGKVIGILLDGENLPKNRPHSLRQ